MATCHCGHMGARLSHAVRIALGELHARALTAALELVARLLGVAHLGLAAARVEREDLVAEPAPRLTRIDIDVEVGAAGGADNAKGLHRGPPYRFQVVRHPFVPLDD